MGSVGGVSSRTSTACFDANGLMRLARASHDSETFIGSDLRSCFPASTRAISRRPLIISRSDLPLVMMFSRYLFRFAASPLAGSRRRSFSATSRRSSPKPMMELSGVLSSWLTFARNSPLSLFASKSATLRSASSLTLRSSEALIERSSRCDLAISSSMALKVSLSSSNSSPVVMKERVLIRPERTFSAVSRSARTGLSMRRLVMR